MPHVQESASGPRGRSFISGGQPQVQEAASCTRGCLLPSRRATSKATKRQPHGQDACLMCKRVPQAPEEDHPFRVDSLRYMRHASCTRGMPHVPERCHPSLAAEECSPRLAGASLGYMRASLRPTRLSQVKAFP